MAVTHDSVGVHAHACRNLAGRADTLPKMSEKAWTGIPAGKRVYCLLLNSAAPVPMLSEALQARWALCLQSLKKPWAHLPTGPILPMPAIVGKY